MYSFLSFSLLQSSLSIITLNLHGNAYFHSVSDLLEGIHNSSTNVQHHLLVIFALWVAFFFFFFWLTHFISCKELQWWVDICHAQFRNLSNQIANILNFHCLGKQSTQDKHTHTQRGRQRRKKKTLFSGRYQRRKNKTNSRLPTDLIIHSSLGSDSVLRKYILTPSSLTFLQI